ncbi:MULTISPECIES: N-6 DNA methylase [unclassified Streptomyces]|uniref:N-6 DNA methylase n=1 Tax=unclassified Streptomyces TaxID=2593676 RepID=UPI0029664FC5|nr:N-6 DNA methylase [Streptomyces sp. SJL17-1]
MRASAEGLVTRSDIARLVGVNRPAVTNWARRHDDFPQPVDSVRTGTGTADTFRVAEVAAWLATRRIPVGGLRAGEPEGTTYGDRFLASLGIGERTSPQTVLTHMLDRLRGESTTERALDLLIAVTYALAVRPPDEEQRSFGAWWSVLRTLAEGGIDADQFAGSPDERRWQERSADFAVHVLAEENWDRATALEAFGWLVEQRSGTEGRRGSELVTPNAVRRLMAELLPHGDGSGGGHGADGQTILDPFCRTGEILDACAAVVRAREPGAALSLRGLSGGSGDATLARMRLNLRDVAHRVDIAGFGWPEPGQRYTAVVGNPPFNQRSEELYRYEGYFPYGTPPRHNGNFAWLQLAVSALAPGGRAVVLMPNIAAQSANPAERAIRAAMVESGTVEALVALPPQLFGRATSIPVTLWLLRSPTGVPGDVLFVDAASLGTMTDRVRRVLSAADVASVVEVCDRWRSARARGEEFSGRNGFSASVSPEALAAGDWLLSPVLHVAAGPSSGDATGTAAARISGLIDDLAHRDERAREADVRAREILSELEKDGGWRA